MTDKTNPLFLERRSYRQRRLMDAVRILPVLGALLWLVPLLWSQGGTGAEPAGAAAVTTSSAILYIFGVWTWLALVAFALSQLLEIKSARPSDRSK